MPHQTDIELAVEPDAAARARAFLREKVTLDQMRRAEANLLVTELIGNVIAHAADANQITLVVDEDPELGLIVSVSHPYHEPLNSPKPGFGFLLLDRVSRSWGHDFDGGVLRVWFSVRTPGSVAIPADIDDDDLFRRMPEDPAAYSDELLRRHGDLVAAIARRYRGKGIDDDDLFQVANMAFLKAIQRYDSSLGSIRPYAAATISGELKRFLRDKGWSVRVPRSLQERALEVTAATEELSQTLNRRPEPEELAAKLDISVGEVVEGLDARQAYVSKSIDKPAEDTGTPIKERIYDDDLELLMTDDRVVVDEALATLPPRQREILDLRFSQDLTQSEIAEEIGISQMHVSRLLSRSLQTLKEVLEEKP